jgi:hypothetical protein
MDTQIVLLVSLVVIGIVTILIVRYMSDRSNMIHPEHNLDVAYSPVTNLNGNSANAVNPTILSLQESISNLQDVTDVNKSMIAVLNQQVSYLSSAVNNTTSS